MNEYRKVLPKFILFTLMVILTFFSCAHKKAYKKALELEKSGQYVQAAEKDLEALDKKSDFTDAKEHLQIIAPKAYEELLGRAGNYERNQNWIEAINSWNHLNTLLTRFQRHGVYLSTINVGERLTHAKDNGLRFYYNNAQQYFLAGDYNRAITAYKNVHQIAGFYLDTKDKLRQAHIRLGDQGLARKEFETAVNYYTAAREYSDDIMRTNQNIAEAYYQWAEDFSIKENYREATEKFETCLQIVQNYRDAEQKRKYNYEKAVRRVAIMPFGNATPFGMQYSNLLTEELINDCIKKQLKYASFMTRSHLDQIMEEHKLAMAGLVDPSKASEIGKLEGIHYFITGNVTQISEQTSPSSFVEKTHEKDALFVVSFTEALAYGLLKNPGSQGADIVCGEGQSLGIPRSFGGPALGMLASRKKYMRSLPGRLVGQTKDLDGKRGFVLTLATREQHIRREKATSNICTNNSLCALAAAMYMASVGGTGIRELASLNHDKAEYLKSKLKKAGFRIRFDSPTFNEFVVELHKGFGATYERLLEKEIVAGLSLAPYFPELANHYLLCVTETTSKDDMDVLVREVKS